MNSNYHLIQKCQETMVWRCLTKIEQFVLIITMAGIVGIMVTETVGRYINLNFVSYEEVVLLVSMWTYMFGAAYGSKENTHISADLLGVLLKKEKSKDMTKIVRFVISSILCTVFFIWSITLVKFTAETGTTTAFLRIPMLASHIVITIGLFLMTIYTYLYTVASLIDFKSKYIGKSKFNEEANEGGDLK